MSFSLKKPCDECVLNESCIDPCILAGAIQGIHAAGFGRNHLGAGVIELHCQNFRQAYFTSKDQIQDKPKL